MNNDIPRQLSASPQSDFYDPVWSRRVQVTLDGAPVQSAITVDANAGWVDVMATDEAGKPITDGKGEFKVVRLYGLIGIELIRGA